MKRNITIVPTAVAPAALPTSPPPTLDRRSSAALVRRVYDCLPGGSLATSTLLRLLKVIPSTEVPSASVDCGGRSRLRINPQFVARWCDTAPRLVMLVMHELHHVLLGHTRQFRRATAVDNLVFDAVINALLCRMFPTPQHWGLLTDFYAANRFPQCLLRPSAGWTPDDDTVPLPPALQCRERWQAASAYRALYSRLGAGYQELYSALRLLVDEEEAANVPLLGHHAPGGGPGNGAKDRAAGEGRTGIAANDDDDEDSDAADADLDHRGAEVAQVVREVVQEEWSRFQNGSNRGAADVLHRLKVKPKRRLASNRAALHRLFRRVASDCGRAGLRTQFGLLPCEITGSLPGFDRRSIVQRALSVTSAPAAPPPLLFNNIAYRRVPVGQRLHVYLDVSGSVDAIRGALYGAVLDCAAFVHPTVHLFSTDVVDVSLAELRGGECSTTYGTYIGCVVDHIKQHDIRRAVLVTDGYVGAPTRAMLRDLSQVVLGVALTPKDSTRTCLDSVTRYWAQLTDPDASPENR